MTSLFYYRIFTTVCHIERSELSGQAVAVSDLGSKRRSRLKEIGSAFFIIKKLFSGFDTFTTFTGYDII